MANSHFSEKKWKYLSIGLMGILATGFLFPQAFAAASLDSVMAVVKDIQTKVNSATFGLQAIKNAVDTKASQTSVDNLDAKLDVIKCNSGIIRPHVDLSGCDLSFADLSGANLTGADLSGANLSFATLESASLEGADITGADFDPCFGDPIGTPLGGTLPDCA